MLPTELLAYIIDHLDSEDETDRSTLLALVRVNSVLYDLGISVIYRAVKLDDVSMTRLFASGHHLGKGDKEYEDFIAEEEGVQTREDLRKRWGHLPPLADRWRRSLRLIQHLTFEGSLWEKTVCLLWEACELDTPLFPNVKSLCLRKGQYSRHCANPPGRPGPRQFFFECPDLCVTGVDAMAAADVLPSRGLAYRNVTYHGTPMQLFPIARLPWPNNKLIPKSWTTFRYFDEYPRTLVSKQSFETPEYIEKGKSRYSALLDAPAPVRMCVAETKTGWPRRHRQDQERFVARIRQHLGRVLPYFGGKLEVCFGELTDPNPPDCPPCVVCGETWAKREMSDIDAATARREQKEERRAAAATLGQAAGVS